MEFQSQESKKINVNPNLVSLGDNMIISNTAIPFLFNYDIENLLKLSRYQQIAIKQIYRD